ncbi:putative integral membrane protein [Theileria parva strain Muguga]|uniref:DUF4203 domain-containing protein n=1 Tax=Theileria parva TaxID=5875 RepID=Q4N4M1_THEPA|nr:putative integral membrane protein [Theileria parva strain Muguga]EAN32902.1 putative integral membrane protein [Theileria parva strain Muguga]|eukprot:XP_765185.1 hypothetical protein [Theileria parva strain Muguga]
MKCLVILFFNTFIHCLNLRNINTHNSNSINSLGKISNSSVNSLKKLVRNTGKWVRLGKTVLKESLISLCDLEYENPLLWTQSNIIGVSVIAILNTFILVIVVKQTSSLFSKGFGRKYMNGGGWWLMLSALVGMLFGIFMGVIMNYSMIILGFSFMLLSVSALLLGRRGMLVGAISGLEVGAVFGTINSGSVSAIITEALLCCFAGVAIGFVPMFPNIKINARYIQRSLKWNAKYLGNSLASDVSVKKVWQCHILRSYAVPFLRMARNCGYPN